MANKPPRKCPTCGNLVTRGHTHPQPQPTKTQHQRRAQTVLNHYKQHGHWCPGHNTPPHKITPPNKLTADHITPRSKAGENTPLQALCQTCNTRKSNT